MTSRCPPPAPAAAIRCAKPTSRLSTKRICRRSFPVVRRFDIHVGQCEGCSQKSEVRTQTDNGVYMSAKSSSDFHGLGLMDELSAAISALGYEEPTPVQREAIPLLIAGRDLLGQAETGTGKTAAFALPMLQVIADSKPSARKTSGLILVPTRELAMQVAEAVHKYAKGVGLTVLPLYVGAP